MVDYNEKKKEYQNKMMTTGKYKVKVTIDELIDECDEMLKEIETQINKGTKSK